MRKLKFLACGLFSMLAAVALPGPRAHAAVACTVSATPLAFGSYNTFSSTPLTTTAPVTVNCGGNTSHATVSYTVAMSAGTSGVVSGRYMANGALHLLYQVYIDAARTQVWGDGVGGTSRASGAFSSTNANFTHTAYGRVPARQALSPRVYSDTLTLLVTY